MHFLANSPGGGNSKGLSGSPFQRAWQMVIQAWQPRSGLSRKLAANWSHPSVFEMLEPRTLLTVTTLSPSKDNTLFENLQGTVSDGAGIYFYVGSTGANAGDSLRRAVLAFDIAASIPAGSTINSVTLSLHLSKNPPASGAQNIELHSLLADWGQGTSDADGPSSTSPGGAGVSATTNDATWLDRFFGANPLNRWDTAGGDFNATSSATTSVTGVGSYSWTSATLTSEVQTWLDNPASNFGWLMKNANESNIGTARRFDSREITNAANRPKLTVDYTPPPEVTVSVAVAPTSVFEDSQGSLVYTFTRSAGITDPLTINFAVTGSAGFDTDYTQTGAATFSATTGTVSFLAGASTATVTITPSTETIVEPDETVVLTVSNGANYTAGATPSASGLILNDDASVTVSPDTNGHLEGDTGTTPYTFTITRSGDTTGTDTVDYVVEGAGEFQADADDFGGTFASGTITFQPGVVIQTVTVNVTGDTAVESDETFFVTLQNPSAGMILGAPHAITTIFNDENYIGLTSTSVPENQAVGTVVGTLSSTVAEIESPFTFSLISGIGSSGNGSFTIAGDQLLTAAIFDNAVQSSYTIRVRVAGSNNLTADQILTVTVADANHAPVLIAGTNPVSFHKKSPPIPLLPNVQVQDVDTSAAFALGNGQLVLTMNAATDKKGKKTLDTIGVNGLSTIGTLTSQHISPGQLQIQIHLLPGATASQIQTFLRGITFTTKGAGLKKAQRSVQIQISDNAEAVATLNQTVNVTAK